MLFTHKALKPDMTPAVVHVDGTSRVQTVSPEQNGYMYDILKQFFALTGVPVLINTSFNLRGEPVVCMPSDALRTFFSSGIDFLAIEGFWISKKANQTMAETFVQGANTQTGDQDVQQSQAKDTYPMF